MWKELLGLNCMGAVCCIKLYGNCVALYLVIEELGIEYSCCCYTCLIRVVFFLNCMCFCYRDCSYQQGLHCNRGSDSLLLSCAPYPAIKTVVNHPTMYIVSKNIFV